MKLKGISTFEQHIEKIVLAVMVVVLLAVVSLQFLTQPNTVDIGGSEIGAHEVFRTLDVEVNKLQAAVNEPSPSLPDIETPSLVEELDRVLNDNADLRLDAEIAFGKGPSIGGEDIGPIASGPIMAMTVPEPTVPTAYSVYVTADPYAVEENPSLAAYLPEQQPLDTVGVSIETMLDGAATQSLLREGDSGHRPIPAQWWRPGVAVIEVIAERQEMGLDGQWSSATPVARFPGAFDVLADRGVEGKPTALELRELASAAESAAEAIVRPGYIPQIAGPEWLPPMDAIERDEQYANMSEVDLLRAKRRSYKDAIVRLEKQLTERPGGGNVRDPGRDPGGKRSGGGGGLVGPSGNQPRTNPDAERRKEERRVLSLQRQIDQKNEQIVEIEQKLSDLGFPVTSADNQPAVNEPSTEADLERFFLGNPEYRVWVHDLDVVPGAVYRYRMRVKVNNPIYGKERALNPALDDMKLADEPYALSGWSPWSERVMVGRQSYLFLSSADEARRTGGGIAVISGDSARVSAEVYHMYYGHYRRGSMTLMPGDMAATDVRVPEDLYLFDTALVTKDVAHSLLGVTEDSRFGRIGSRPSVDPRRSNDPFDNPPRDIFIQPDPGGSKTGSVPDRDRGTPAPAPEDPIELPEGVTVAPTRISVQMDAVLLEVVRLPITEGDGSKPLYHVYFETEGGQVEYRRPDHDRGTEAYELVRASYLLGRTTTEAEEE